MKDKKSLIRLTNGDDGAFLHVQTLSGLSAGILIRDREDMEKSDSIVVRAVHAAIVEQQLRESALTLNELQELASRTLPTEGVNHYFKPPFGFNATFPTAEERARIDVHARNVDLIHAAFGLAGEVGELIDPVKKAMFYGKPLDVENLREEAGDLLWYIAGPLCRALGCTLEELARENVAKLQKRYPEKYTDEAAIVRADKSV